MLAHDDPEYLHQLRVGWRRLRSLLQLAALITPEKTIAPLAQELRWLGSILGPARDCDVFAAETLPEVATHFRGQRGIARLRARTTRRRKRLTGKAREAIATARFQRLLLALGAYFTSLGRASAAASVPTLARDWIGPLLQKASRPTHPAGAACPSHRRR